MIENMEIFNAVTVEHGATFQADVVNYTNRNLRSSSARSPEAAEEPVRRDHGAPDRCEVRTTTTATSAGAVLPRA